MADYTDFEFELGDYGKAVEYNDENAIILAVRNILLSKPGNFPFNPSIGMNIKQYQFEFLDEQTVSNIQTILSKQIAKYIPSLGNVDAVVRKVELENGTPYLAIDISANLNGNPITADFILKQQEDVVSIFNEIS